MSNRGFPTQDWFEMRRELTSDIMRTAWVPLVLSVSMTKGEYGYDGFQHEVHIVRTLIVPAEKMNDALSLEWGDIVHNEFNIPYVEDGRFYQADSYTSRHGNVTGIHPVLVQRLRDEPEEWHLHQDLVLGLGLKREGDDWVCPAEDYVRVIQLKRNAQGNPESILIRMEHLRDFLCAHKSGLLIASYRQRSVVVANKPVFDWKDDRAQRVDRAFHWEGHITPIAEGGHLFGSSTAVIWAGRKTPEPEDEVPIHKGPGDEDIESTSWEIKHEGKKLYDVRGDLWLNEWIPPAARSPRVMRDSEESTVGFIMDASGQKASDIALRDLHGWLWFKPSVIEDLLSMRHGTLGWYTKDTGGVGPSPSCAVPFGVNSKGLINVYAKDIYSLPEIYKRIWQAHNVLPDGPPSQELWMAQMQACPAKSSAPEKDFFSALADVERVSLERLGGSLLKHHDFVPTLLHHIHRFRGNSLQGLCSLAKDLDRLVTERIDTELIERYAPPSDRNVRSIRRLSHLLDTLGRNGREMTAPLAGINTLRQGDAHLPSSELHESLELAQIPDTGNYLEMAQKMIEVISITVAAIADALEKSSLRPK